MAPITRSRSASHEASFRVAKSSGKTSTSNKSSKAARDAPTRNEVTDKRLSELQKLCTTYKVSANGTRIELIKRLLKHINYGQVGDAILVTEARIPGQSGTIANVREALRGALENTTFNVREILGRTFIGDGESLEYAAARMEIPQVRHTVDELKERAETAENQVREMENELNQCKDMMLGVRMRFINCFKRDKLGATGDPLIAEVSRLVHSGDAITDAGLFVPDGPREDKDVYEKLYGFTPEEVRRIGDDNNDPIIQFLSLFASIVACKYNKTPNDENELSNRMILFAEEFRASGYNGRFLNSRNKNTDLYRAYSHCRNFIREKWRR